MDTYTYEYEEDRLVKIIRDNGGAVMSGAEAHYTYNEAGQLVKYTTFLGASTTLTYDAQDRLVKKNDNDTHIYSDRYETLYHYNALDQLVKEVYTIYNYSDGNVSYTDTWEYEYDADGRLQTSTEIKDGTRTRWTHRYDYGPFEVRISEENVWQLTLRDSLGTEIWQGTFREPEITTNDDGLLLSLTAKKDPPYNLTSCEITYAVKGHSE